MARVPEILERAGKPLLAASILLAPSCASANETPNLINQPITTTVTCDPVKYAESIGIPTPVPVGDSAAPAEMVTISRKVYTCEPLSDAEKEAFRKFNITHPLLETVTDERAQNPIPPTTKPLENKVESPPRLIIPPEFYSKAELVEWKTLRGTIRKMIGFKEANIPFLAPDNLQVTKNKINEPATFHGFEINMFDPNNPKRRYIIVGDLKFDNMHTLNVLEGTVVAHSQSTGIENLGYKVLFYILDVDQNTHIASADERMLSEMFPAQLHGAPHTSSDYRGPQNPATNYEDTFYSQKK